MAVDAETKRSFFTNQLAGKLEQEGIDTPAFILDVLDKPFASFTAEDTKIYETSIKDQELLLLFARLLQQIYEAAGESTKHSWKGMCHLLKDSPIKVCVSYAIGQEEGQPATETQAAPPGRARLFASAAEGEHETGTQVGESVRKSYFTKKLERKLEEREIKVPASILSLLDKSFDEFSPDEQRLYEEEFKGRQLIILFSDLLDELYEETGRCSSGWNGMCRYLKNTPMKLIATYVVQEEERLEEVDRGVSQEATTGAQIIREKYNVKPYKSSESPQKDAPSRWRRKA